MLHRRLLCGGLVEKHHHLPFEMRNNMTFTCICFTDKQDAMRGDKRVRVPACCARSCNKNLLSAGRESAECVVREMKSIINKKKA
jgi:hypothetical protein